MDGKKGARLVLVFNSTIHMYHHRLAMKPLNEYFCNSQKWYFIMQYAIRVFLPFNGSFRLLLFFFFCFFFFQFNRSLNIISIKCPTTALCDYSHLNKIHFRMNIEQCSWCLVQAVFMFSCLHVHELHNTPFLHFSVFRTSDELNPLTYFWCRFLGYAQNVYTIANKLPIIQLQHKQCWRICCFVLSLAQNFEFNHESRLGTVPSSVHYKRSAAHFFCSFCSLSSLFCYSNFFFPFRLQQNENVFWRHWPAIAWKWIQLAYWLQNLAK